jgi:hypothetical protein
MKEGKLELEIRNRLNSNEEKDWPFILHDYFIRKTKQYKRKYKSCSKCKQEKLRASDFYNDKRSPDGLDGRCKPCQNSKNTKYKKK